MFRQRPLIGDLQFPPRIYSYVLCVKEPDGTPWTSGRIDKHLIIPRPGVVYTVRSSIRSSQQDPLPLKAGILLVEIVNKLCEYRRGVSIEPFWPCNCFTVSYRRP